MAYYKCGRVYTTQNSNVVADTASGPIANFETPLALPLIETKFGVKATQDLNGQSGPYPAGGSAQIWDEELESGYIDNDTGGNTSSYPNRARSKNYIPTTPQTAYYFVSKNNVSVQVLGYDENKNYIGIVKSMGTSQSFTTLENCYFIRFKTTVDYALPYKNDFSINYPATDIAYHPYSNICPINGVSSVSITKCGKNLFDGVSIIKGYPLNSIIEAGSLMRIVFSRCKPNTRYTISKIQSQRFSVFWCEDLPAINVAISNLITNNLATSISVTTGATAKYICAFVYNQNVDTLTPEEILSSVQIEENTEATAFEAYNGSTTLINLGGTYYGGYISQDKDGKREFVVTWCVLTDLGSLNWGASNVGRCICNPSDMAIVPLSSIIGDILSDCYKPDTHNNVWNRITDNIIAATNNPNAKMVLYDSNLGTKTSEEVKAYLSGKSVIYGLAEPFTVALPDGEPIKSLPGINNIFCDTGDTSLQFRKIG